jgi:hypothetical protein
MLIPESETAIVVLTNSLSLNDVPDWVGQLILEALLDVPRELRNDYIEAAKTGRVSTIAWYPTTTKDLLRSVKMERRQGTHMSTLERTRIMLTFSRLLLP